MRTVNPEQHARKRAAILESAAVEFAEKGVDGASTAAICRRAGIGSGTLFHYFPTKNALFHALFADDLATNTEACRRALADRDPASGLDSLVAHLVSELGDPLVPGLAAAAMLQVNRDPKFAALMAADERQTLTTLTALLDRMAEDGADLPFPPARVARWVASIIDSLFLSAMEEDFDPESHLRELRRITAWLTGRA